MFGSEFCTLGFVKPLCPSLRAGFHAFDLVKRAILVIRSIRSISERVSRNHVAERMLISHIHRCENSWSRNARCRSVDCVRSGTPV